jgi:subtilisin family serine protease
MTFPAFPSLPFSLAGIQSLYSTAAPWGGWISFGFNYSSLGAITSWIPTGGFSAFGVPDGMVRGGFSAPAATASTKVELLVQFDAKATDAQKAAAINSVGGKSLETVRAAGDGHGDLILISVSSNAADKVIEALSHNPAITFAEQNWGVAVQATPNDPYYTGGNLWGMYGDQTSPSNVYGSQAGEAWANDKLGSTTIVIGDIDTGIDYTHQDLYLNIWLNQNELPAYAFVDTDSDGMITFRDLNQAANSSFVTDNNVNGRIDAGDLLNDARYENGADNDGNGYVDDLIGWDFVNNDNDPYDDNGHGTHTTGTIGATGFDGSGVIGVSPNVQIVALKFLSSSGSGSTSGAIKAQDYYTAAAVANPAANFIATSNSWGGGGYSQALYDSIVAAARKDILFVAAAGNNSSNNDSTGNYPSNYSTLSAVGFESVIAVAALQSNGALASYSNYGALTVDLGAPGSGIYSTVPGGGYASYSGTSMATPHVAGALALFAAAHPDLTAEELRTALLSTTVATSSLAGKTVTGGRLDVWAMFGAFVVDPNPKASISTLTSSVTEGNSGSALVTFTVTLNQALASTATIDWSLAGSGSSPASADDFTGALSGTLTFDPGVLTRTIEISVAGDVARELDEQFTITLSNPSAGLSFGQSASSVTIVNDDDDYAFDATTTGALTIGGPASTGVIDYSGDADAFSVTLTAGVTYTFAELSTSSLDPFLYLYDSSFRLLASNDDANGTLNSQITFTATQSGTYYLGAKGYSSSTGSYSLTAVNETVINGTTGNDVLNGSALDDTINGLAGNDTLYGNGGNDSIYGSDGADTLDGGDGNDLLDGGAGVDTATYAARAQGVTVDLRNTGAQDTIGAGNDTLTGIENLVGSGYGDTLTGDAAANRIDGGAGDDLIDGAAGNDVLIGGANSATGDTLSYASAAGAVTVSLAITKAQITGGGGTDTVSGFENLVGSASGDTLTGNTGANAINGGAGGDIIVGGGGRDLLTGGAGADFFDFNAASETGTSDATADVLLDFLSGTDRIDLFTIDASSRVSGNNAFTWNGTGAITSSSQGELRYQVFDNSGTDNDYTMIYGDTDSDTAVEFAIRIKGIVTLSASDFVL